MEKVTKLSRHPKVALLSRGASLAWRARSDSGSKDGKKGLGWQRVVSCVLLEGTEAKELEE